MHGYGAARGLAGLPQRVQWALLGLLLAGLVALWSLGRRFGPPEDEERPLPPPRIEYVDALAARARAYQGGRMKALHAAVAAEVGKVVVGQEETLEDVLVAVALGGHVLLEGVPGVAKTLLAGAIARALGVEFRRLQFTPDMLPSDVTGTMALRGGELVFRPGPVFANVVLADEINRTPPKTQAALLEAMQEAQVTVDGEPHPLPDPFLVLATQNPVEYEGTYPLPEAQRDRFLVHVDVGYPSENEERAMLRLARRGLAPTALDDVRAVADAEALRAARAEVDATEVSDEVIGYVVALVRRTRELPSVTLGASPRAAVHLLAARQGRRPARRSRLRHPGRRRAHGARGPAAPPGPHARSRARARHPGRRHPHRARGRSRAAMSPTWRSAAALAALALLALVVPLGLVVLGAVALAGRLRGGRARRPAGAGGAARRARGALPRRAGGPARRGPRRRPAGCACARPRRPALALEPREGDGGLHGDG